MPPRASSVTTAATCRATSTACRSASPTRCTAARCSAWHLNDTGRGDETDLLATDWFAHADRPLAEVRADFGLRPRSERAVAAGSHTAWERGGISPFQFAHGQEVAEAEGRAYESYGAEPA